MDLTAGMNKSDNSNDVTSCVTWRYSVGLLACLTSCTEGPQERRGCSCYLFFMLFYELLFVHSCVHLRFLEDIFVCFALLMFPLVVFIFLLLISYRFCNSFVISSCSSLYFHIIFSIRISSSNSSNSHCSRNNSISSWSFNFYYPQAPSCDIVYIQLQRSTAVKSCLFGSRLSG